MDAESEYMRFQQIAQIVGETLPPLPEFVQALTHVTSGSPCYTPADGVPLTYHFYSAGWGMFADTCIAARAVVDAATTMAMRTGGNLFSDRYNALKIAENAAYNNRFTNISAPQPKAIAESLAQAAIEPPMPQVANRHDRRKQAAMARRK